MQKDYKEKYLNFIEEHIQVLQQKIAIMDAIDNIQTLRFKNDLFKAQDPNRSRSFASEAE